MQQQNSIKTNAFHLLYSTAFSSGLNALTLILAANYLHAGYYGMFSIALAYSMVMGYCTDAGLSVAVLREGSKPKIDAGKVMASYVKMRLVLWAATLAAGFSLIQMFYGHEAEMKQMMFWIMFPMVSGLALQSIGITYFQLTERMQYLGMIRMLSAGLLVGFAAASMLFGLSPFTFAFLYGFSYFLAGLWSIYFVQKFVSLSFKQAFHKGLLSQMWLFILSGLLIVLMPHLGPIVLEHTLTLQQIGFFAVAYRIPSALYQIPGILAGAVYPALFKHYSHGRLEEHFQLNTLQFKGMALIGMAMAVPLYYMPELIIHELFGREWGSAAGALRILSFILVLQSMNIALADGLTTRQLQSRRTGIQAAAVAAGGIFYFLFSRSNGVEGAAAAAICLEATALAGYFLCQTDRVRWLLHSILPYAAVFTASTFLITRFWSEKPIVATLVHLGFLVFFALSNPVFREKAWQFMCRGRYTAFRPAKESVTDDAS